MPGRSTTACEQHSGRRRGAEIQMRIGTGDEK
jgi:hypothetical protein